MTRIKIPFLMLAVLLSGCSGPTDNPTDNPSSNNPSGNGTPPTASITIKKSSRKVTATAAGVLDDAQAEVRWDWTNDGTWDTEWSTTKAASYTYSADDKYTIKLEVRNAAGQSDSCVRTFNLTYLNHSPKARFAYNLVHGMTVSVDASGSYDGEDASEDLAVQWDWDGDGTYDTNLSTIKTAEHTYETCGKYTIKLKVVDLNGASGAANEDIIASPTTIRSSFFVKQIPYVLRINFRMINNLTEQPVSVNDTPKLMRDDFSISEDGTPIDLSETNYLLTSRVRPMHLVLILDYTGSMYDEGGIPNMVSAAKAFIDSQPETTSICLWGFWERQGGYAEIDDFIPCDQAGKNKLKADLDTFTAQTRDQGATEIWDLIKKVIKEKFVPADIGINRAIVFLSDGHDTTSKTTVSGLITLANKSAINLFAIGVAFRPEEFPTDEPNLIKLAEKTGGTYFSVNQVEDLTDAFNQMSEDLRCDWTLSYITLKSEGTHTFSVKCDYLDGMATINGLPFTPPAGDIRKGLLSVKKGQMTANETEYVLYADYIPRNIYSIKVKLTSPDAAGRLTLYDDNEALCTKANAWTISPDVDAGDAPPADGWYTISSGDNTPLEFGGFGKIAKCTVSKGNLPNVVFELPPMDEQTAMYTDKTIVFAKSQTMVLRVPTVMTDINGETESTTAAIDETIIVNGRGFCGGDQLVMMVTDAYGDNVLTLVKPSDVAEDGSSMEIKVPKKAQSYKVWVLDDYVGKRISLEIGSD